MLLHLIDVSAMMLLSRVSNPRHNLRVSSAMRKDMRMWRMCLECINGSVYFLDKQWSDSRQLQLFTDSAGGSQLGCAAILGSRWSFLRWPFLWSDAAILMSRSWS